MSPCDVTNHSPEHTSPQSVPPHIQGFLHLRPALPAYSNSNSSNNNNFIRKEHGPWGLLPDLICQPIHHNCKQERDQSRSLMQSYNNLETLRRTYLAPLLCLATLVHVLYHFHILLCTPDSLIQCHMSSLGTRLHDF